MGKAYAIRVDSHRGTTTIRLSGDINMAAGRDLRAAVADSILGDPPHQLVIDLTAVTYIDRGGVDALGLARHAAGFVGARFDVKPGSPTAMQMLETSDLIRFVHVAAEPLPAVG